MFLNALREFACYTVLIMFQMQGDQHSACSALNKELSLGKELYGENWKQLF